MYVGQLLTTLGPLSIEVVHFFLVCVEREREREIERERARESENMNRHLILNLIKHHKDLEVLLAGNNL